MGRTLFYRYLRQLGKNTERGKTKFCKKLVPISFTKEKATLFSMDKEHATRDKQGTEALSCSSRVSGSVTHRL